MKLSDGLQALQYFFNDIVGNIIPGLVLGVGLFFIHNAVVVMRELSSIANNGWLAILVITISYAAGHFLLAFYNLLLEKVLKSMKLVKGVEEVREENETRSPYLMFKKIVNDKIKNHPILKAEKSAYVWHFNDLRNIAFSISRQAALIGRRFMFISLLCQGVGTAFVILAMDLPIYYLFATDEVFSCQNVIPILFQALILVFIGYICIHRGALFYSRAMLTPFSIAVTELLWSEAMDISIE